VAARRSKASSRSKTSEREALSEADIVQAALRMLQREGASALSMRKLAAELRVTPMAIYYHVPHKRALVERITDAVLESVPTPEPSGAGWERELKNTALECWQRLSAYPGLVGAVLDQGKPSKAGRRLMRYNTAVLLAAGFDMRAAVLAMTAYNTFVYGVMAGQTQRSKLRHRRKRSKPGDIDSSFDQLDPGLLMEYGLDTLIAGLRGQLPVNPKRDAAVRTKPKRARMQPQQPD
jgi:AcrR family transcriptional regulator